MSAVWGRLRKRFLGISPGQIRFASLGFREARPATRACLERIPVAFAAGYHAALEEPSRSVLGPRLERVEAEHRGFAYEGAAMALALLDGLTPWPAVRVQDFLAGAGAAHVYMVHVGVGWAMARLHRDPARFRQRLDPSLGWLAVDGYGFHEGFFHWRRYGAASLRRAPFPAYTGRAFDQGFGRSLWFVEGADVPHIAGRIAAFALDRQPDLWSGIGLAAVYAGGIGEEDLHALIASAEAHGPHLAQGAAFAAKARLRAGIVVPQTRLACRVLCRMSVEDAADLTDTALEGLPADGAEPPYEAWRRRIQAAFAGRPAP